MLPLYEPGGFRGWAYQNMLAIDQWISAFFNGYASETISARCYRNNYKQPYKTYEKVINFIYLPLQGPDHCRRRYLKEQAGINRPPPKSPA